MSNTHYIVLMVAICSISWTIISLTYASVNKKRMKEKNKNWKRLYNESTKKFNIERGLQVWNSLGTSKKKMTKNNN